MKTRPFNAATHKPEDKLVCGGDPVTELIVGTDLISGIRQLDRGERFISVWTSGGRPCFGANNWLEVLTPEPEKPREWWVKLSMIGLITEGVQRVPRDDVLASKARGWHLVREVLDPEEAKAVETTEGQRQAADDKEVSCEGTSSGLVATVGKSSPSTHIGYVPLHNGVPQWDCAGDDRDVVGQRRDWEGFTGPVVECVVKPKPMTRKEAMAIAYKHYIDRDGANVLYEPAWWVINAILEAANGRAEGV